MKNKARWFLWHSILHQIAIFGQERTLKLSKRPFDSVVEMDRALVNNWNKTVSKDDTVFVLGDFGEFHYTKFLNGQIHLIKGNYSRHLSNDELRKYFDVVYTDDIVTKQIERNGIIFNVSMTHEPMNYINANKTYIDRTHINLFGHIHKLGLVKPFGVNTGSDCHCFYPIDLETILFYHNSIFDYYDDNVFS